MKPPFPAFFLEPARNQGLPVVTVRPCLVIAIYPGSQVATIEIHSLQIAGRVSRHVPFAELASTAEIAAERSAAAIKLLPALAVKSAAIPEVAGVGSSAGTFSQ